MNDLKIHLRNAISKITLDPRKLFLIDACGALLSAFLLGIILTRFESTFGMPRNVLYFLALVPCIFALYSFSCFFKMPEKWQPFLKAIAYSNQLYCCVTMGLVLYFYQQLTWLGVGYFVVEIVIVVTLAGIELKASNS